MSTREEELQSELMEQCRLLGMSAERELKLLAEIEQARRTAEYWKAEHIAANVEIERLRAVADAARAVLRYPNGVDAVPYQRLQALARAVQAVLLTEPGGE